MRGSLRVISLTVRREPLIRLRCAPAPSPTRGEGKKARFEPNALGDRPTPMKSRILFAALTAFLALAAAPASATDEHDYARDEYAIIRDGLAPSKQMSLASHADPDDGHGTGRNFHVWLMAEPAHRKLARLPDIGPRGILDTGPDAYHTFWSADSRHVAVTYRSDRHLVEFTLFEVQGRRVRLTTGPSLFRDVTGRDIASDRHGGGDDL